MRRKVLALAERSTANATVTVQRRAHPGYCFVHKLLSDFVKLWRIPISYIDIYHADGMWCMPGEMCTRSYHPYKHGYGKLMHSGYHFLDLLMWLHSINEKHVDFPAVLCEALDCIWREQDVKAASTQLGISTSQMVKLLAKEPTALQLVNGLRASSGLPPLRN